MALFLYNKLKQGIISRTRRETSSCNESQHFGSCCSFLRITSCNKVRRKEGSGQGWLVKTQVFLLTQINSHRCALRVTWPHRLSQCLSDHSLYSFRLSLSYSLCARVFTPSLSLNSCSTVAFIWSPRQLLQSDTGVPHFALDPLTYRCLLSPSPAADFAEPRLPRHTSFKKL